MTEPEYRYVKGQGWVLLPPHEIETYRIGNYNVTFEKRQPALGEFYWSGRHRSNVDFVISNTWWLEQFQQTPEHLESKVLTRRKERTLIESFREYTVISFTEAL